MPTKKEPEITVTEPSTAEITRPPHYYEITQTSVSERADGTRRLNQEIIFREFADSSEELVMKNMPMMKKVAAVLVEGSEEAAQAAGYVTEIPTAKK